MKIRDRSRCLFYTAFGMQVGIDADLGLYGLIAVQAGIRVQGGNLRKNKQEYTLE